MGSQFYLTVTGKKQGQFRSESTEPGRKDKWIPALGFEMALEAPHDPQSGLPTGKRQFSPVRIVKEWGAASPQALTALATNETLTSVVMQFVRVAATGTEFVYQTVTLTNAAFMRVARVKGAPERLAADPLGGVLTAASLTGAAHEWEEWAFTFQKIAVEDINGKTSFADDWEASSGA
jgi:type VI secretion system secreted protein Hcp